MEPQVRPTSPTPRVTLSHGLDVLSPTGPRALLSRATQSKEDYWHYAEEPPVPRLSGEQFFRDGSKSGLGRSLMATLATRNTIATRSKTASLPIKHAITLAYAASLVVAVLVGIVSATALVVGSAAQYGVDPKVARGVTSYTAGLIVPGFLAQDIFNLVVALPILLGSLWFARRGSTVALLVWPGALFYMLYTYSHYLVGAQFNSMFLAYAALVALSAFTTIGLVSSIDGEIVRRGLSGVVPARIVGGILVVLALLTLAQDGGGSLSILANGSHVDPGARSIWIGDSP